MPPILPPGPIAPPLSYTVLSLVTDALIEIGAVAPGENPSPEEAQWAFRKLNYLLDTWQAMRKYVYSFQFQIFNLVAGLSPHTIGPSPGDTFVTPQRPVRVESCALILNASSTPVDLPMNIRDKDWWALQQTKGIQTNVPTDVYYNPAWPDGQLYFWPVPNSTAPVRLQWWVTVSQFVSIMDPIGGPLGSGAPGTQPPAYRAALMLTLAESLLSGSNRQANPGLPAAALSARVALLGNNDQPPRISTQDAGMPRAGKVRPDFNWATGGAAGGPPE